MREKKRMNVLLWQREGRKRSDGVAPERGFVEGRSGMGM